MDLLSINVTDPRLKGAKILIHGTCVESISPRIYEKFLEGRVPLSSCPERDHVALLTSKISTMMRMAEPREITVLTIDGSPHCLQIHHAVQQAQRLTHLNIKVEHFVIEHQKLFYISHDAVKASRHLSTVQKLIDLSVSKTK